MSLWNRLGRIAMGAATGNIGEVLDVLGEKDEKDEPKEATVESSRNVDTEPAPAPEASTAEGAPPCGFEKDGMRCAGHVADGQCTLERVKRS